MLCIVSSVYFKQYFLFFFGIRILNFFSHFPINLIIINKNLIYLSLKKIKKAFFSVKVSLLFSQSNIKLFSKMKVFKFYFYFQIIFHGTFCSEKSSYKSKNFMNVNFYSILEFIFLKRFLIKTKIKSTSIMLSACN